MIRPPTREDFRQVMDLYKANGSTYAFDPFRPNTILEDAVVIKDDKIIAYGMVKLFAEAVLVVNKEASKIEKGRALIDLMKLAMMQTKERNIGELYTFADDDKFTNQLIEQFGFQQITSSPLVREL